jgi:hypothetical protein
MDTRMDMGMAHGHDHCLKTYNAVEGCFHRLALRYQGWWKIGNEKRKSSHTNPLEAEISRNEVQKK